MTGCSEQRSRQMDCNEFLNTTTDIAYALLESGAEIYRVEEAVTRIFDAYGVREGHIFAIPTLLILSMQDESGKNLTTIRRLGSHGSDLSRVNAYNDLCRAICREKPDFGQIRRDLARIGRFPNYTALQQVAAGGMVAFGFALLFGGSIIDAACALAWGILVKLVLYFLEKYEANGFFTTIVASFVAAGLSFIGFQLGLGENLDKIIIGVLMNLVPGVVLTNVMRDMIAGDLIAGLTKLAQALITATGIALGTGTAISLGRVLWGVIG